MSDGIFHIASKESSGSKVQQNINDLEQRLNRHISGDSRGGRASPAENCLLPLLRALAWDGMERHLFEALPHLEEINSTFDLRAVLTRLNFRSTRTNKKLKDLTAEHFPCLLSTPTDVFVCYGRTELGKILAYSGTSKDEVTLPASAQDTGDLYLINQTFPGEETDRSQHWFSNLFRQFRGTIMPMLAIGFLVNLLALALPIFVMNVYDKAISSKSVSVLFTLLIGIAIVLAADFFIKRVKGKLQAYFGSRLDSIVANTTFRHFLHLPLPVTVSAPIGAQITRLRQFEGVRDIFHGSLANALIDLPFSALFIATLALIGGPVALLPMGLMAIYILAAFSVIPRMKRAINSAGEAKSRLQNITVETLTKQKEVRDLSADSIWLEKFRNISAEFAAKNLKTRQLSQTMQIVSQMMMTICGIGVLGFGAIRVLEGHLTQGALIAVMALSWRSLNPMHQAFLSMTQLGQAQQTVERINALMKLDLERQPGKLPSLYRTFQGNLSINGAVLRYAGRQEPALRGVNLTAKKGEIVAVTGPSGSGKSSLLKAVLGLYRPQMGAILVDNVDIRQLDPGEWRYSIGYAPDHYDFFYGTIAQNMRMADPQAPDERVEKVAREFGLDQYDDVLTEGLDTRLTGRLLSRIPDTVKQRILLARTFLRPAPIYLLDNPAGNLDFDGDKLLMRKIESLKGRSTVILTTYRPSHMRMADHVAYMRNGQIVLDGAPDEVVPKILDAA